MLYTLSDVSRQFDAATFNRGCEYARTGRVLRLRVTNELVEGEAAGSGRNVYRQVIALKRGRQGVEFVGSCSCPVSYNCKHVVAVLLAALERPSAAPSGSSEAEEWMRQAAQLQASMHGRDEPLPKNGRKHDLLYILMPGELPCELRLHLCDARLRADGRIASVEFVEDIEDLLYDPPSWLPPEERDTIRLVRALDDNDPYEPGIVPEGHVGALLLSKLCDMGRLSYAQDDTAVRKGQLYRIEPGPPRLVSPAWTEPAAGDRLVGLFWKFEDGEFAAAVLPTDPVLYVDRGMLGAAVIAGPATGIPPARLATLIAGAPLLHPEERAGISARMAELGLDQVLPLPLPLRTERRSGVKPTPCLYLDSMLTVKRGRERWDDYALLSFDYDGLSTVATDAAVLRRMAGNTVELIERDADAERSAAMRLAGFGFARPAPGTPLDEIEGALCLPAESDWAAFARDGLPRLLDAGWQVEFEGNYRYDLAEIEDWYAELDEGGEAGAGVSEWFELELGIVVGGERHPLLPVLLEAIRQAPHDFAGPAIAARDDASDLVVDLKGFTRVALPWGRIKPILATLGELYFGEHLDAKLRLRYLDAARLAELEQAARLRWVGGERMRAFARKLHDFDGIRPVAPPAGLQATLRDYQRMGLAWMQFLREYGFGGILADDMGLGKTVQTLAHILAEQEAGRLDAPALVVAPTSLMGNWQAEAARFAPGLRVLLLHGKERKEAFDRIPEADLVLTTYALLGRDEAALRKHRYHLLILDEAQYIKNSRSKAAQVACLLEARHRLCLTGTPVQNHLGELWSQFHFLMPGLLGNEKDFASKFRKPIEQQGDSLRRDLLARRLKPFMLRRTKDKVATELPPKTEIVLPIELGSLQRDLYETVRLAMDKKVRDAIDSKGLARSQIVILDALLKLRQVCCHPRLLRPASPAASAKMEALMELLDTLLSEGRKVLVFSQFTSMLALVGDALRERGVAFALLTGDTEDRTAVVADFQQGRVGVFLISLKAGGVGLNLTAADTVIHYDPWWNPAAENQATDRAWRIGQEQPVFVYKLIAKGTLEEKIQDMQRRKGDLANALLAPEAGLGPAIGADDLQEIFGAAPD